MVALPALIALSLSLSAPSTLTPTTVPAPVVTAPVQLDVVRDRAGTCPDAATLRARVRERVGSGGIVDVAARHVIVVFTGVDDGVVASVRLLDEHGDRGRRTLGPLPADCRALGGAVVLAVSLVVSPPTVGADVEPTTAGDGGDDARDDDRASSTTIEPTVPPSTTRRARRRPVTIPDFSPRRGPRPLDAGAVHVDGSVGAGLGAGVVPGTGPVFEVAARLGSPVLHVGVDVTGHLPGAEPQAARHTVAAQAVLVGVDGCAGSGHDAVGVDACIGVGAGVVRAVVDGADADAVLAPAVVPRVTASLAIEVAPRWAALIGVRAGLPTARLVLRDDDDAVVWSTPDVAFALGIGVRATFGP